MDSEQPLPIQLDQHPLAGNQLRDRLLDNLERRAACEEMMIRTDERLPESARHRHEAHPGSDAPGDREVVEELDSAIRDEVVEMLLTGSTMRELQEIGISREYLAMLQVRDQAEFRR